MAPLGLCFLLSPPTTLWLFGLRSFFFFCSLAISPSSPHRPPVPVWSFLCHPEAPPPHLLSTLWLFLHFYNVFSKALSQKSLAPIFFSLFLYLYNDPFLLIRVIYNPVSELFIATLLLIFKDLFFWHTSPYKVFRAHYDISFWGLLLWMRELSIRRILR